MAISVVLAFANQNIRIISQRREEKGRRKAAGGEGEKTRERWKAKECRCSVLTEVSK